MQIKNIFLSYIYSMSATSNRVNQELLNIEIAIELDKGKKIAEVAEIFDLKISAVKAIAREMESTRLNKKTAKSIRFTESEREILVGRIEAGESVENISAEAGVKESTIRRWCKQCGVSVPRSLNQISLAEQKEIRDLLEENDWREIGQAYNISLDAIEELAEPAHRLLDSDSLSFLFEILREQPLYSAKKLCRVAREAGISIPESAVSSYRKRLKVLGVI